MPSPIGVILLRLIAGLRRAHEIDRNENVLLQQVRQLLAGGGAVVRNDRVADVFLILQQTAAVGCASSVPFTAAMM